MEQRIVLATGSLRIVQHHQQLQRQRKRKRSFLSIKAAEISSEQMLDDIRPQKLI